MQEPQHIHTLFLAPLLDAAVERLGQDGLDAILEQHGRAESQLRAKDGWVGNGFVEALCDDLVEATGDPQFIGRACQRVFTGDYLGVLKPVLRAFGTPRHTFQQMVSSLPRFNKTSSMRLLDERPNGVTVEFIARLETSPLMCMGRVGQFVAVPHLFDQPSAEVHHPECIHEGDARCLYEVTWQPVERTWSWLAGPILAGAAMALVALAAPLSPVGTALCVSLALALGAAVGRSRRLRSALDARSEEILDHDNALQRSAIVNERRYAELLAAKEGVEQQVAERTAALRETTGQLSDALAEVRSLDEAKTRFFANVSHELRTPLQLILAPLDDLVDGREPAGGRDQAVQSMQRAARRLHRLINQLLDLARADAGAERVAQTPLRPAELARQVCDTFRAAADAEGIRIHSDGDAPVALLDAHWMESALTNLVANALRHCDAGDRVTVRVGCDEGTLRFEVEDTGPGIPAEDLPAIFDRFAQSRQKEGGARGTGLGLAIVLEAARLHDGTATVASELGQGTTFTLTMPLRAPDPAAAPAPALPERPARGMRQVAPEPTAREPLTRLDGPRDDAPLVIVAEDNPDLRLFVAGALAAHYRVIACEDGALAWEQCRLQVPDLVVTDGSMPRMTGLELTEHLRSAADTREVPVVLLTAHTQLEDVLAAYDAGANDYVTKPFHARELLARAHVHVHLRQLARDAILRERRASIGLLAAEVAHHVRNPLNMLVNGLPVLATALGADHVKQRALLSAMEDCASRIQMMSSDLLYVAGGPSHRTREPHHVRPGLQAAARMTVALAGEGSHVELGPIDDGLVLGVAEDVSQIWLNLLEHAVRSAGPAGSVRVTAGPRDDRFEVVIEDSGTTSPDALAALLQQSHVAVGQHVEGTGLGLAIAARIATEHGGAIDVARSSELGGSRFTTILPLHGAVVEVEA